MSEALGFFKSMTSRSVRKFALAITICSYSHFGTLAAQQPPQDAEVAKQTVSPGSDSASSPQPNSSPLEIHELSQLAARLAKIVENGDCQRNRCAVLFTDFVFSDGKSSVYGKRIADELGSEMSRQFKSIEVIGRKRLDSPLKELQADRVPGPVISWVPLTAWFGAQVNASTAFMGQIAVEKSGHVKVSGHLLNVIDGKLLGGNLSLSLPAPPPGT